MTRDDLKGKIQTVTGLIEPDELGPTLMHEHILCDITPPPLRDLADNPEITLENRHAIAYGRVKHADNYKLTLPDVVEDEVRRVRDAGGRSIVELTIGGLKPDPEGLAAIARATDVQIVIGCGHYVEEYQEPAIFERSVDSFAEEITGQVLEGAWGTNVRAGLIGEIGCQSPWTAWEHRVMEGALIAQAATGTALNVHPGRDPDQPQEVADFVQAKGGEVSRLILSHIDRTIFDHERLFRLADTGCVLEFDLFGIETTYYAASPVVDMPNDGQRLATIRKLIERGHLDQIVISHDICYRTRLRRFGGHGYDHIFVNVVPLMESRGYTPAEIDAILIHTPRRLLTIQ